MPELPEVETVMRGLETVLAGRRIAAVKVNRGDLRRPFPKRFAARLEGRKVLGLERRAKYILAHLDDGETLLIHLGMSGRFTILDRDGRAFGLGELYEEGATAAEGGSGKHDHVVLTIEGGKRIVYTDPRRFGVMDLVADHDLPGHPLLAGIGVEPLSNSFSAEHLADNLSGKKAPLKAALLDQSIIAGLGNIYVCEALHRARLSPLRRAGTLGNKAGTRGTKKGYDPRLDDLVRHIRDVLNEAIEAGGSTLRDHARPDGRLGDFQHRFAVYDKEDETCPRPGCGGTVRRIVQAGRSTFYCPRCQK